MKGGNLILCLLPLLSASVNAQKDSKWSWSSNNNRNNIDGHDRQIDRRKYESIEDLRDRYEVNEQTTRKPNTQNDDYYGNGGNGFGINPNSITGNGYNGNGFGAFVPQGLGGGPGIGQGIGPGIGQGIGQNNFNNFPLYGNQFNGPYNPGFGSYPNNNIRPGGFNNNFYPNGGFPSNYGNGQQFPGGYGPNRYPNQNPYNPLGNSATNGILVGPGGPTGLYGRPNGPNGPNNFGGPNGPNNFGGPNGPNNFGGPNQLPFNGNGFGGAPFNNGFNNGFNNNGFNNNGFGGGFNGGFPPNGPIPFNSKSGSGILAEADEPNGRELDKKSNE